MKNVLMASSAIVGATALMASPAAAQTLEWSAFSQFFASGGGADVDGSDQGYGFSTNTEVHVKGEIMADNGITFGMRVEFEADAPNNDDSDMIDENSIYAQGSFGKVELGQNDGAEDTFMVNGSNSGVDYGGIGNPTSTFLTSAYAGNARTSVDFRGGIDTSDASKVTYTTPNFNGFSAGISYTPDTECRDSGSGAFCDENDERIHDNIGLGLGFDGEFNGVGVELGLVGAIGEADQEPEDTAWGIGGGFAISFSGFTIAAGGIYDDYNDGGNDTALGADAEGRTGKGYAFDAGIGYGTGPWSFSVNGLYSKDKDSDDKLWAGSANVGYNLAPGVNVFLTGFYGNEDYGSATQADTGENDNDIVAVTSGLKLSF